MIDIARRSLLAFSTLLCANMGIAAEPVPAQTRLVSMRDGVRLATDIYLPTPEAKDLPCILMRTPYGRTRYNRETGSMARWGYAVAIQDTRGRFDSQGKAMGFQSDGWGERQDGYDTVQWLAKQDFCNGRVATVGASAMGITQNMMAPAAPPNLVCQYILVAPASLYHEASYVGGVLRKKQVEDYLRAQAHGDALQLTLDHPEYDAHWREFDTAQVASRIRVPAIHYGGWFDTFSEGTIRAFLARQHKGGEGARGRQILVMGPWTHGGPGKREFGDFELPEPARSVPLDISARRWFDFYLKDKSNGIDELPAVIYYVMGPFDGSTFDGGTSPGNVWRTTASWPVPAVSTPFYLHADGSLSRNLASRESPGKTGKITYTYDPIAPTPTHGGRNLSLPAGPKDQRRVEARSDVVTFTTSPLAEDLEVTGHVAAKVFFSSDVGKMHVAARLCDVYPDGRSILIAEGIGRLASACDSAVEEMPEKPTEVDVDLWSTSIVFAKGHRIRLSIASANYPRWEAAPGGALNKPAHNTIHVGHGVASRLILPVVQGSK